VGCLAGPAGFRVRLDWRRSWPGLHASTEGDRSSGFFYLGMGTGNDTSSKSTRSREPRLRAPRGSGSGFLFCGIEQGGTNVRRTATWTADCRHAGTWVSGWLNWPGFCIFVMGYERPGTVRPPDGAGGQHRRPGRRDDGHQQCRELGTLRLKNLGTSSAAMRAEMKLAARKLGSKQGLVWVSVSKGACGRPPSAGRPPPPQLDQRKINGPGVTSSSIGGAVVEARLGRSLHALMDKLRLAPRSWPICAATT